MEIKKIIILSKTLMKKEKRKSSIKKGIKRKRKIKYSKAEEILIKFTN